MIPRAWAGGLTIGNDVRRRDIEGENPLYLPQAKVYDACCAGAGNYTGNRDAITGETTIHLRSSGIIALWQGSTSLVRMVREFDELIGWLGRDNRFPGRSDPLDGHGHRSTRRVHPRG